MPQSWRLLRVPSDAKNAHSKGGSTLPISRPMASNPMTPRTCSDNPDRSKKPNISVSVAITKLTVLLHFSKAALIEQHEGKDEFRDAGRMYAAGRSKQDARASEGRAAKMVCTGAARCTHLSCGARWDPATRTARAGPLYPAPGVVQSLPSCGDVRHDRMPLGRVANLVHQRVRQIGSDKYLHIRLRSGTDGFQVGRHGTGAPRGIAVRQYRPPRPGWKPAQARAGTMNVHKQPGNY